MPGNRAQYLPRDRGASPDLGPDGTQTPARETSLAQGLGCLSWTPTRGSLAPPGASWTPLAERLDRLSG